MMRGDPLDRGTDSPYIRLSRENAYGERLRKEDVQMLLLQFYSEWRRPGTLRFAAPARYSYA
jgi:hypothetical protein